MTRESVRFKSDPHPATHRARIRRAWQRAQTVHGLSHGVAEPAVAGTAFNIEVDDTPGLVHTHENNGTVRGVDIRRLTPAPLDYRLHLGTPLIHLAIHLRLTLGGLAPFARLRQALLFALHRFAPALLFQLTLLLGPTLGLFLGSPFGFFPFAALLLLLGLAFGLLTLAPFRFLAFAAFFRLAPGLFRRFALGTDALTFGLGLFLRSTALFLGLAPCLFGFFDRLLPRPFFLFATALLLGLATFLLALGLLLGPALLFLFTQLLGNLFLARDLALVLDLVERLGIHRHSVNDLDVLLYRDLDRRA